jgi:hypothetical protein
MTTAASSRAVITTSKPARGPRRTARHARRVFQGWPTRHRSCFFITSIQIRSRQGDRVIPDDAWTATKYTNAIFDDQQ